ncbi:hypothetical protein CRN84_06660 [Budvicia aquatica]|uniref:Uncharacterized protein n=1 Tax=Budvicia aquatica TaxID=82979 RepID=A0A2C6CQS9_9GAMM|nr:hypothetical protein CRN84_06660 [Budvicia aquatica]
MTTAPIGGSLSLRLAGYVDKFPEGIKQYLNLPIVNNGQKREVAPASYPLTKKHSLAGLIKSSREKRRRIK